MAGLAAVACAFLFRPSVLRAQGATGEYPNLSPAESKDLLGKRSGDPGFVLTKWRSSIGANRTSCTAVREIERTEPSR